METGVSILKVRRDERSLSICSGVSQSSSSEAEAEGKICVLRTQVSSVWRKKSSRVFSLVS